MSRRPKIIVAPVLMFVVASPKSPEMSYRAGLVFNGLGAFAFCIGLRILEWAAFRAGLAISLSESPSPSRGAALAWMCFLRYRFKRRFYEIFIRVIILVSRRSQRRRRLCRSLLRPLRKFPFGYEYVLVDDLLFTSRIVLKENVVLQKSKAQEVVSDILQIKKECQKLVHKYALP